MQVDDNSIFLEYYNTKSRRGIPLSYFLKSRHLLISPRKFYLKFLNWLIENGKNDIHHTTRDFLLWILDHTEASQTLRDNSLSLLLSMNDSKIRNKNGSNFTELTIATAIFCLNNGGITPDLLEDVGLSQSTIEDCMRKINILRIMNEKEERPLTAID